MSNYLTSAVEALLAYETIARPFDAVSKRAKRVSTELVDDTVRCLRRRNTVEEPYEAHLRHETTQAARGMRDGIEAFKKAYPKQGAVLEGFIEAKREEKKTTLVIKAYEALPDQVLLDVLTDVGIDGSHVRSTLQTIRRLTDDLERSDSELRILV